ncbi:hypothetical protein [Rhizobium wuzhouense]|uniref:Uncharacterized protein n=1 Tax=Rhizobium wuzhouense TaxID=1986026 RepID=A0ABX5NV26_9HYPH|nr:hypothetical protein [Rhizobium wuzhouense]PYB77017.1 hypothetical protein DMY87_01105 [Rhizobium wuzhouense]
MHHTMHRSSLAKMLVLAMAGTAGLAPIAASATPFRLLQLDVKRGSAHLIQVDTSDTSDPNGGGTGSPDPNGGSGGSPDPNGGGTGSPDPNGGSGGSPDPNGGSGGSPDPNGGGTGSPDPNGGSGGSPDPNGGSGGSPDPNGGSGGSPDTGGGSGSPDPDAGGSPDTGGGSGSPDPDAGGSPGTGAGPLPGTGAGAPIIPVPDHKPTFEVVRSESDNDHTGVQSNRMSSGITISGSSVSTSPGQIDPLSSLATFLTALVQPATRELTAAEQKEIDDRMKVLEQYHFIYDISAERAVIEDMKTKVMSGQMRMAQLTSYLDEKIATAKSLTVTHNGSSGIVTGNATSSSLVFGP